MQRMTPSRRSAHASLAFLLGLLLLCCNVESEQVVIRRLTTGQQRRRGTTGQWTSNSRRGTETSAFTGLYSKRLGEICADVECPSVVEEQRAGPGIELRKYQRSEWVAYGNDHWKFKNIATTDYKEHFMVRVLPGPCNPRSSHHNPALINHRPIDASSVITGPRVLMIPVPNACPCRRTQRLIDYQLKNNLLEAKLPITTPIIHEMTAIKKYVDPTSGSIDLDKGFTMRVRIHSRHQGDPGAKPTEKLMTVASWTPTSTGWVAVHQYKMKFEDGPEPREAYEKLRTRLRAKLANAGAEDLDPPYEKFYFVVWGSPANRLYEIWIPVTDAVASVLMK